jgi:O-antigen/teichoic acid export membrane protein
VGGIRLELRETAWASIAGALQSLGPFGSFWILARLTSAEELGRYSLAVAVAVPVFLAARMQLRQAAVADPQGGASFGSYRRLRVFSATVSLAVLGLFAQTLQQESCWIVCAVALVRWSEEIGDIHYAPAQRASRWRRIAASQLLRLTGALLLLPLGWRLAGLPAALVAVALWQAAVTVCVDAPFARILEPVRETAVDARALLRLNWPLGATAAVVSLISYAPRYALAWSSGESAVGDYAALAQAALFGNLVVQGAGQASLGKLGTVFVKDHGGFRRLVRQLLLFAGCVGIAALLTAVLWGDVLLGVVFHPRFAALHAELVVMVIASLFVYATSVFGYALTAAGVKAGQLAVFGTALVVGLSTAFPLSSAYGIAGAVASTACSWATAAVLSGRLLRTVVGDPSDEQAKAGSTIRIRAV